jgi:hypothetical protein
MKRVFSSSIFLLTILTVLFVSFAGTPNKRPPLDGSSNYTTFSVVPARSLTAAIDSFVSQYYFPGSVSNVIFWLQVDTITSGGTIVTNVQTSPDAVNWTSIARFTAMTAAGQDRQTVTLIDKYIRVTDTVSGAPTHVYRKVFATPKSNFYWDARILNDICIYDSSGTAVIKPSEKFLQAIVKGLPDSLVAKWNRKDTSATPGVKAVYTPTMAADKADKAGSAITGSFWYSDSMHSPILKSSDRKSWKLHVNTAGTVTAQHDTTSN